MWVNVTTVRYSRQVGYLKHIMYMYKSPVVYMRAVSYRRLGTVTYLNPNPKSAERGIVSQPCDT